MNVALGLPVDGDLPSDHLVVEVLLVAKVLDEKGEPYLLQMSTPSLTAWEAAGMAIAVSDERREMVQGYFIPDDEPEE